MGLSKPARLMVDMPLREKDTIEKNYADSDSEEEQIDAELQDRSEEDDNEDTDCRDKLSFQTPVMHRSSITAFTSTVSVE
ncbi:hypothetical protein FQA39_LY16520 [Lamprigera yunnana]|nr:hypothetical protein FQA39_LY16520 [Lamprigera yunnana]